MFSNVWKLLKENKFQFDDEANKDLLCGICKNLMINACNAPCGCRFCSDCIEHYLDVKFKFCPGKTTNCQIINFVNDIVVDWPINIRISRLIVNCPIKNCQHKEELDVIESHMKTCSKHPIMCPFNAIGCEMAEVINEEMKDHLNEGNYCHSKLLIDLINSLRKEINLLKKENIELKKNKQFTKQFDDIKLQLKNQQREICKMELKEKKFTREIKELKKENRQFKQQLDNIESQSTNQQKVCKIEKQIPVKTSKIFAEKTNVTLISESTETFQTNFEQKIDRSPRNSEQDENKENEFVSEIQKLEKYLKSEENFGFLEWKIRNLSQKIGKRIFSKPFYSGPSEYKMCLGVTSELAKEYMVYQCNVFVNLHLMRGEFDDKLNWPFELAVTVDVIDPTNGYAYKNRTIKYSDCPDDCGWEKPTTEKNIPINIVFVPFNCQAVQNNQLELQCRVVKKK